MPTKTKRYVTWAALALIGMCFGVTASASTKVMLRLHEDDGQYSGFPDSYPVCKTRMDYMHYDGTPTLAKRNLFDTKVGWIEIGVYAVGGVFDGTEVLRRLRTYEDNGMEVAGVSLYREDWLSTDTPGGAFPIDWRILSADEIAAVRNEIAIANPPLRCKDSLKIIQLLGAGSGAWGAGSAQNFPIMDDAMREHLKLFDGLGVECHVGDHEPGDRQSVIIAMAEIAKWTAQNGKTAFVFMGGGAPTYENLPRTQLTYRHLWSEMLKRGVDYRADDIVYFRQGAWGGGKHTPESAYNTLTHQQRWLINTLKPAPGYPVTSLFVSEVQDQIMIAGTTAVVPFIVGEAEMEASELTVSATSSNPALVPNANLTLRGRGIDRIVAITPNPLQTGTTRITLTVNDGTVSMTNSFLLAVLPFDAVSAVASGDINDSNTWSGAIVPGQGDIRIWQTGTIKSVDMSATNTATFLGGTLEVQTGGQFAPGTPGARLTLNKLSLNGGTIFMGNNLGLIMDLGGQQFTLGGGTLKSGSGGGMGVTFKNGALAGSGSVNITSAGTGGAAVDFQDTIQTLGFAGTFNVSGNGVLNLPPIPVDNASFGLNLSGTGKYANDSDVALTSLVISGANIPPGTYAYDDFTPAQRAFLASTNGVVTVTSNSPPTLSQPADQTLEEDGGGVAFAVAISDAQTAANALTLTAFSSNPELISQIVLGGSGTNRTVTLAPALNKSGTALITLEVSDGWFRVARTFSVTVNDVNDVPVLSAIGDQVTNQRTAVAIPFTAWDAETASAALAIAGYSSNQTLLPDANILFSGTGSNRIVTLLPAGDQTGSATITLTVGDGTWSVTNSFGFTVLADADADGDGMTDNTERSAGREPNGAGDLAFEFNTARWFEGWGSFAGMTGQNVGGGTANGTTTSGDPQLTRGDFLFAATNIPTMVIKLKSGAAGTVQFYWGYVGSTGFSAAKRRDVAYTPANTWKALLVPLAGHAEWDGKTIVNLRIDPISVSGAAFEIDWIRASAGDLDNDGIPDSSEGLGDSNGNGLLDIEEPNGAYEQWAETNAVAGGKTDDDDDDGLRNLAEYALGGIPTNPADLGHIPTFGIGGNWFEYVHIERRAADSGVTYTVEVTDNLVAPVWTTNGVEVVGAGVLDADFNSVTNRISTEAKNEQFIRLRIE